MSRLRLGLLGLLAVWMFLAWPNLEEQWGAMQQARAELGPLSWEERSGIEWRAGHQAALDILRNTPPDACVAITAQTTPEKLAYYQARFPYYLYPRKLKWGPAPEGCGYVALFSETGTLPPLTGRILVFAGDRLEIYR